MNSHRHEAEPEATPPSADAQPDAARAEANAIARKFDSSTNIRTTGGAIGLAIAAIAIAMSLFHLATAAIFTMSALQHRAVHLTFAIVLVFLLYPAVRGRNLARPTLIDLVLAILGAIAIGYLVVMFEDIARRGIRTTTTDLAMGVLAILLVLEGGRRSVGIQLPLIAVTCLAYAYLGPHLPGMLAHRGFSVTTLIERMYLGNEGIFGIALGVSATYVFLFVLFGAFLNGTGMAGLFTNAAIALAGHKAGGPAKVSILTSGFLGMINGSAVANVATTGVFTIPLMKSVGYRPKFAAGVEAVASTGGQITPPIMGAAAFIMAEFLGIQYTQVIVAAMIPATLYFFALWWMVHYEAKKGGLAGVDRTELPRMWPLLKQRGHLVLPVFVLLGLLFSGYTPIYAAFYSILATVAISYLRKDTRMGFGQLVHILEGGAKGAVFITMATAVVGIIIGVFNLTGIGLQLASMILTVGQGYLFATLVLTMIACIVLGMGLPTTACYIVAVVVAAPALTQLGVPPLAAHLLVLYYAVLSNITPPVALASYTAAGIANANPTQVSWIAVGLGTAGYIVPLMFAYSPSLLLLGDDYGEIAIAVVGAGIGVYALAIAVVGYWRCRLNLFERAILLGGAVALIQGGLVADLLGLAGLLAVGVLQSRRMTALARAG